MNDFNKLAEKFEYWCAQPLVVIAKAVKKSKEKKKLNPSAKTRNRGFCAFPAESPNVSDHADHYPLGSENQARNAWARAHQTGGKAPSWYKGTYTSFLNTLKRKIHSKFKGIELGDKKKSKKSSLEILVEKYS